MAVGSSNIAEFNTGLTEAQLSEAFRRALDTKMETALIDAIDSGSKNILKIANANTSETKRGITATYDFDNGTITLNGAHDGTGDANFYLYIGNATDQRAIPAGSYHLSGCPSGGSTSTYCLIVDKIGGSPVYKVDTGDGISFTIATNGLMAPYIRIKKPSGQTVSFDNVVFKPMICKELYWNVSNKYVPYRPTLDELWASVRELQNGHV